MEFDVSVVIPHVQGEDRLRKVIDSLGASFDGLVVEVCVVLNGGRVQRAEIAKSAASNLAVKFIQLDRNHGFATGCNIGESFCSAPDVLFLNDDVVMPPRSGRLLVEAFRDTGFGAMQPIIVGEPEGNEGLCGSSFTLSGFLRHHKCEVTGDGGVAETFVANGACLLVSRRAFAEAGGFDDRFFAYFEESDLQWRMRLHGWLIGTCSSAFVYHVGGATAGKVLTGREIGFLSFRNRLISIIRNIGPGLFRRVVATQLACVVAVVAASLAMGYWSSAAGAAGSLWWTLRNWRLIADERSAIQKSRVVDDALVLSGCVDRSFRLEDVRKFLSYGGKYR